MTNHKLKLLNFKNVNDPMYYKKFLKIKIIQPLNYKN